MAIVSEEKRAKTLAQLDALERRRAEALADLLKMPAHIEAQRQKGASRAALEAMVAATMFLVRANDTMAAEIAALRKRLAPPARRPQCIVPSGAILVKPMEGG